MLELTFDNEFNLKKTFECGQNFRFNSTDNGKTYYGTLNDRVIKLEQINKKRLKINSNIQKNLEIRVKRFLRFDDDYALMLKEIQIDELMKKIVIFSQGLRLIKQDMFECSISYLLSQCSNIPRIKHHLNQLSTTYGKRVQYNNKIFFLFPSRDDLTKVTLETFINFKFGYRAKYIYNFIQNYPDFLELPLTNSEIYNQNLQCIEGIGQKVADCIQLFSCGDLNNFPVDVWINKFMIKYYNNGKKASAKKMNQVGQKLFRKWAGYAQEFIYYYARETKINL